jgi:hypothetical protein
MLRLHVLPDAAKDRKMSKMIAVSTASEHTEWATLGNERGLVLIEYSRLRVNLRHVRLDRDDVADDILLIKSELSPELRRGHDGFALSRRTFAQIADGSLQHALTIRSQAADGLQSAPHTLLALRAELAPSLDVGKHALALLWRHAVNLRQPVHEVLLALRRKPIKAWFIPQSLLLLGWRHVLVLR